MQADIDLGAALHSCNGLDMENDLGYLLGLVGEALRDDESFDDDSERAEWVIAQWCQELQYLPDLRDYETGTCVPPGEIPDDLEMALHRERRNAASAYRGP